MARNAYFMQSRKVVYHFQSRCRYQLPTRKESRKPFTKHTKRRHFAGESSLRFAVSLNCVRLMASVPTKGSVVETPAFNRRMHWFAFIAKKRIAKSFW